MSISGILNVSKPEGRTSFSVVDWLRRLTGEKRVGHAGTLDPRATGVLPVCFGQGTRVIQFLLRGSKIYLAQIELGVATDTFDSEGKIVQRGDMGDITTARIEEALTCFVGVIEQVPPVYSALKHHGKRCYELARAGNMITMQSRRVEITRLELVDCDLPLITIKVVCGKGTYIRSLAHDLGQYLGCGAYLKSLIRLRYGPFDIKDALSVDQVEEAFRQGCWRELLHPVDSVLLNWSAAIVNKGSESTIRNGNSLHLEGGHLPSDRYCRVYNPEGDFVALLRFVSDKKLWHPEKVFPL